MLGLARIRTNAECDGAMLEEIDGEEAVARIHIAEALSYRGETFAPGAGRGPIRWYTKLLNIISFLP